ncbi:type I restriction-modification system subunit M [Haloferula sp. A504]|uniref:type I restriction-modification system subunit M n=1 Tax=Haloferula sp. A504 TaxID=3373601 RepID=UPI0031BC9DAB|nr:type I restriction-modification system subunit M [Verrucomicrobiaceae bacterium E54]
MAKPIHNQAEINEAAWRACDTFRGLVDAENYRNYILVMLFWKYASDVWRDHRDRYMKEYDGDEVRVQRRLSRERFQLPEGADFYSLYEQRSRTDIGEKMNIALAEIEEANKAKLEGVFREVDFNSESKLGETRDRNPKLKQLLEDFADKRLDLRPSVVGSEDVIGNVYEYLLERFASDAGKKAGEFYTPAQVSRLIARILDPKKGDTICDPACGSGSLLIQVGRQADERDFALFGQEMNGTTHALCRMNMFLHGMDRFEIKWGDTLRNPRLVEGDQLMKFDIVVANPPFSLDKWGQDAAGADPYVRYHRGIPPKSKGDYAFITHMIETAREGTGKVGVVVPHGVLFRGAAEGKIRKALIEENLLEAVIGLPANLFFGTGIPAAILIFNKGKTHGDVLFIDASREFKDAKNQNVLTEEHLDKIVATYRAFETVDKYAYRATPQELADNDFNLNIPRYVDTFEEEEEIDLDAVKTEINTLEAELAAVREKMKSHLDQIGL